MKGKLFIFVISCILIAGSVQEDTDSSAPVISRNERIQEMIDGLNIQNDYYSEIMEATNHALEEQNEECKSKINEMNCSNVEVWENLRRKHSKNITNLQDKMKKHTETIQQILKVNKELVEKKNSSLLQLFPEVKKLKNDQEMIDIMLMVIDDTYVRVEDMDLEASETNSTAAVFILSEMEKELKEMGKFVQLKRKEGPKPPPQNQTTNQTTNQTINQTTNQTTNETTTETITEEITENTTVIENVTETGAGAGTEVVGNETGAGNETKVVGNETNNETGSSEDVPLIDEEIFNKEAYGNEAEEEDLFGPAKDEEAEEEAPLIADEIPEGKDVKEHDEGHLQTISHPAAVQNKTQTPIIEHYELKSLKMSLKQRVKQQGREMFKELSALRKELKMEQESKLEQINAYERAIYLIHQKHMHEIIQIYKENRNLYIQILEKDDAVMQLDAKINECRNIQEYEASCEDVKDSLSQFAEDSKSQINFNNAAIKELEKLLEYEDKNVFDPAQPEEANQASAIPQGPMHYYEDYGQTDDGQLVKRTIVCKVTECRQKHVASSQQFQLLLKKKYDQLNEDQLLKETQEQEEKGTELDQRFEIKERTADDTESEMPEEEQITVPVEPFKQQVQNVVVAPAVEELTPINDENIISEMKDKLDSDVGGGKIEEQKEQPQQLQQQAPAKINKQKIVNQKHQETKLGEIPQPTKTKKVHLKKKSTEEELTEPKPVENEEKEDSNIFSQALHYLFGSKNAQTFTEIRETHSNGPLDFLAQLN